MDLEVDEKEPRSGILQLLQVLRPGWSPDQVQLKSFTEGMTNRLIGCFVSPDSVQNQDQDCVLVRVYGQHTDLFVDRSKEVQMLRVLECRGLGSKVYCSFRNGLCYEFLQGVPLSYSQLTQRRIYRLIAAQMARLHSVQLNESEPFLWKKMEHFLNFLQNSQSETREGSYSQSETKSRSRFWSGPLPGSEVLRTEMDLLKSRLSSLRSPVVLCHNDLLSNNIIYCSKTDTVRFIDYEYMDLNYQAFDIANHFNEFAGLSPLDYRRYPSPELQKDWIRKYLENYNQETGRDITEQEVTHLYILVCKFSLASNLFWGMWAILQSRLSSIDFDFSSYAAARLNFYFEKRDQYLCLDLE